jgi:hypothetical protein
MQDNMGSKIILRIALKMKVEIYNTPHELGKVAGIRAAQLIHEAIEINGTANIILATGTSQLKQ